MKKVLLIGLDPAAVDYARWPGLTAEALQQGLSRDVEALGREGYSAKLCFIEDRARAESSVGAALADDDFDAVLIGAGVRTDQHEFELFETLVNTVHRHAPQARICFNTGPTDSVAAVKRWT